VTRLIQANRLPHLLFYGPPGTGKTSTVLALAKQLYGSKWRSMTLEVSPRARHLERFPGACYQSTMRSRSVGGRTAPLDYALAASPPSAFPRLHPALSVWCLPGVYVCSSTPPMTAASTWCATRSNHSQASAARWRVGSGSVLDRPLRRCDRAAAAASRSAALPQSSTHPRLVNSHTHDS
jgi:DNA polymerase III delta prime subunit